MNVLRIILIICLLTGLPLHAVQLLQGRSIFSPRSQSTNAARDLVGWHPYLHRADLCKWYTAFAITPSFSGSVRPDRIAAVLFGTNKLAISGSLVPNRDSEDILADYFGLPPSFISTVCFDPLIQNGQIDLSWYIGFDSWCPGLYFRAHAPLVWTRWDLRLSETIFNAGNGTLFPALYMDFGTVNPPAHSFSQALAGGLTFGQESEPLLFGRVCGANTHFALSDVQLALGYDFILCPEGHLGFNLRASIPTGTRPDAELLFQPIVGNGKHWEAGLGFTNRTLMWERDGGRQELSLWAEVNLMHLFKARQRRSFDLCINGFGSRWILAKEFTESNQYAGTFLPAINKTTLWCDVSVNIQLDIVFMAAYRYKDWWFDVGYNGWIRSREQIELLECIEHNRFGLKGIQNVAVFGNLLSNTTQSSATVEGNEFINQGLVVDSNSPVFFNTGDLNLRSGASPLVITHKVFGHVSHQWCEKNQRLIPFLGIGAEIEFEGINENANPEPHNNTLSQWTVWLKGGVAY